jgi:hypothetical protein
MEHNLCGYTKKLIIINNRFFKIKFDYSITMKINISMNICKIVK